MSENRCYQLRNVFSTLECDEFCREKIGKNGIFSVLPACLWIL